MATMARMTGTIGIIRRGPIRPRLVRVPEPRRGGPAGRSRVSSASSHGLRAEAAVEACLEFVLVEPALDVVLAQSIGRRLALGVARALVRVLDYLADPVVPVHCCSPPVCVVRSRDAGSVRTASRARKCRAAEIHRDICHHDTEAPGLTGSGGGASFGSPTSRSGSQRLGSPAAGGRLLDGSLRAGPTVRSCARRAVPPFSVPGTRPR